jgi:Ger(x)C family germination protein
VKKICILIFFLPLIFAGCWDRKELEEFAYVSVIGIDRGEDGMARVTYQLPRSEVQSGSGSPSGAVSSSEIVTFSAPSHITARDLATASVSRRINFSHVRAIILSEDVARTSETYKFIFGSLRDREFRRNTYILVTREKAEDFIRGNNPKLEQSPHKFYDYMSRRWLEVGLVPIATINDFAERYELKSSLMLTAYGTARESGTNTFGFESNYLPGDIDKTGGNPVQIIGAAVFKGEKMIGALTGEETRLTSLLGIGTKADNMHITFPDPIASNERVTARLTPDGSPKIIVDTSGEYPKIHVKVPVNLYLLGIPSRIDYSENLDNQKILKNHFADYMKKNSMNLIQKTQTEFKGDPFQWSLAARKNFRTLQDFLDYDWMEKYTSADVKVNFEVKLRGIGKQLRPPVSQ